MIINDVKKTNEHHLQKAGKKNASRLGGNTKHTAKSTTEFIKGKREMFYPE